MRVRRFLVLFSAPLLAAALMTVAATSSSAGARPAGTSFTAERPALPDDAVGYQYAQALDSDCGGADSCVAVGTYIASDPQCCGQEAYLASLHAGVWTSVRAPLPANASQIDPKPGLQSVSCAAADSCVAVGTYESNHGYFEPLIETLVGGTWQARSLPVTPGGSLGHVSCNTTRCVAIGSLDDGSSSPPLIADGSGSSWHVRTVTTPPGDPEPPSLSSVSCPATGACAVNGANGTGSLFFQRVDGQWTGSYYPVPADTRLGPIDCPVAGTCTSLAFLDNPVALDAVRLVGWQASAESIPLPARAQFPLGLVVGATDCTSATVCAGVATAFKVRDNVAILATRDDSGWTAVAAPMPSDVAHKDDPDLYGVSCRTASDCVAVGDYRTHVGFQGEEINVSRPLVENFDGATWTPTGVSLPDEIVSNRSATLLQVSCYGTTCAATGQLRSVKTNRPTGALVAVSEAF